MSCNLQLDEMADLLDLLYVMCSCVFVTFPYDVLGQVWYLIVYIPDLCIFSYFEFPDTVYLCCIMVGARVVHVLLCRIPQ